MRPPPAPVRRNPAERDTSLLVAAWAAACLFLSACNPFSDPGQGNGTPNYNPLPEGVYFFSRVTSGWAFGNGTICSLEVVRRPLPAKPDGSGNPARFQDETRGTCASNKQGVVDSTYATSRMDTVFFHEAGGNLIMDSADHFFGNDVSVRFPQSAFQDSGSSRWEDCVYSGGGGTKPCKRMGSSEGSGLDLDADTLVFLRGFGLLYHVHVFQMFFHGVYSLNRIRLEKIIRGKDTLDFDGSLAP